MHPQEAWQEEFQAEKREEQRKMEQLYFQHQKANNDPSGNPQRVYVIFKMRSHVFNEIGHLTSVARIDEGYAGMPWKKLAGMIEIPPVMISKSDYHSIIRELPEFERGKDYATN